MKMYEFDLNKSPFDIDRMFGLDREPEKEIRMEFLENIIKNECDIKAIHCSPKAKVTVVIFDDGSKEISRCAEGDEYNEYAGICICIAKHFYGKSRLEKIISRKKKVLYNDDNKKKGAK